MQPIDPTTTRSPRCGLLCPPDPENGTAPRLVALEAVQVDVSIVGPVRRTTIRQTYVNRESIPVEAVYVFPLDEGSAVCHFSVALDGHVLEGRIEERDAAFDAYDDALAEGRAAFLLDQERPNVFHASVGNLLPGQEAVLEIVTVGELPREGDGFRFVLPQTIMPRYLSLEARDAETMDDFERVDPPRTTDRLGYEWTLTVRVDLFGPIAGIESPTHRIATRFDGDRAEVTLARDDRRPDRDFVLKLLPQQGTAALAGVFSDPCVPPAVTEDADGTPTDATSDHVLVASFRPDLPTDRESVDVLFVVDCSGSMYGAAFEDVRRTLRLCLHSLHPGDRFDVVRFGSHHERLFGRLAAYDEASLDRAVRLCEEMDADLGGTEILDPLQEVLAEEGEGRPRRVVLLTDGGVANEDAVIDLCARHRGHARVFSVGIGRAVSEQLVRGVARASGGTAEFVASGESVEDKVLRQFRRLGRQELRELTVEGEGVDPVDLVPWPLPTLVAEDTLTLFARVRSASGGTLVLRGRLGKRDWEQRVEVLGSPTDPAPARMAPVPVLWARERIRQLEETEVSGARVGSRQEGRRRQRVRERARSAQEEIIALGRRYGLASRFTSWVVVDEREGVRRADRPAQLRRIPTALVRGWQDAPPVVYGAAALSGAVDTRASAPSDLLASRSPDPGEMRTCAGFGPLDSAAPPEAPEGLDLIFAQKPDGSWDLDATVLALLGLNPAVTRSWSGGGTGGADAEVSRVAATHLVLAWLEREGSSTPASWEPALEKARAWLSRVAPSYAPPEGEGDWASWAHGVITA